MKTVVFKYLLLILVSDVAWAQFDTGKRNVGIAPVLPKETPKEAPKELQKPEEKNKTSILPEVFKPQDNKPLVEEKPLSMTPSDEFMSNSREFTKVFENELNKIKPQRKKQSLGTIKIKTKSVIIRCRDSQAIDGDQIRVFWNENLIANRLTLSGGFQGIEIQLDKGYNYIDFKVINEGDSGPNTAQYEVIDKAGNVLANAFWDMRSGDTATMVLIRE